MGVSARFSPSLLHRACLASVEHMRGRPSCRRTDGARRPCAVLTQRSCARGGRVIPRTASDSPRRQRLASGDAAARSRPPPVARCASGGEQVTTAGGKPLRLRAPGKVRDRPGAGDTGVFVGECLYPPPSSPSSTDLSDDDDSAGGCAPAGGAAPALCDAHSGALAGAGIDGFSPATRRYGRYLHLKPSTLDPRP